MKILPSKACFKIDGVNHNICVMFDACHMLILGRNTLAKKEVITSGNGLNVEFKYIERLHALQTKEGIKFASKLSHSHVLFGNKNIYVKLAAQMLSNSVANALKFVLVIILIL